MFEWIVLLVAGLFEIVWVQNLKLSQGFTKPFPTFFVIVFGVLSCYFLALAERAIPLGIAYAIWSGIGSVGVLILGAYVYGESITLAQLFFLALVIVGIIGIKLSS